MNLTLKLRRNELYEFVDQIAAAEQWAFSSRFTSTLPLHLRKDT